MLVNGFRNVECCTFWSWCRDVHLHFKWRNWGVIWQRACVSCVVNASARMRRQQDELCLPRLDSDNVRLVWRSTHTSSCHFCWERIQYKGTHTPCLSLHTLVSHCERHGLIARHIVIWPSGMHLATRRRMFGREFLGRCNKLSSTAHSSLIDWSQQSQYSGLICSSYDSSRTACPIVRFKFHQRSLRATFVSRLLEGHTFVCISILLRKVEFLQTQSLA